MVKFTFLELHVDDATITNNAPYSGSTEAEEDSDGGEPADGGGRSILGLVVLSVVLSVVAALAARAMLGGDEQPVEFDAV